MAMLILKTLRTNSSFVMIFSISPTKPTPHCAGGGGVITDVAIDVFDTIKACETYRLFGGNRLF